MRQTPLQRLVDLQLDGRLREVVLAKRAEGLDWRTIAAEISATTGHSVSYESLRSWFAGQEPAAKGA